MSLKAIKSQWVRFDLSFAVVNIKLTKFSLFYVIESHQKPTRFGLSFAVVNIKKII